MLAQAAGPVVQIEGTTLTIAGPDDAARETAMLRLLDLLDARYPHAGAFPEHAMYEKAGMVGRTLEAALREAGRD